MSLTKLILGASSIITLCACAQSVQQSVDLSHETASSHEHTEQVSKLSTDGSQVSSRHIATVKPGADITLKSIPSNTLIAELDVAYNNKDYTASINLANSILKELPNDAEILLIKGISLLEKNKLDESLAVFDSISNELFSDEANWYAGMVLLKQNKIDAAKTRFQKIKGSKYLKKIEKLN